MKEGRTIVLTLHDTAVLLYHVLKAAKDFGHLDAERTLRDTVRLLGRTHVRLETGLVESGLYSCSLLNEQRQFLHPGDRSFESFVKQIAADNNKRFNYTYGLFEEK